MSVLLLVSKIFDHEFNFVGEKILLEEWVSYVEKQDNLRIRTEPYIAQNPSTGETIEIAVDEGESEIIDDGEWVPFLSYSNGELCRDYGNELDNKSNDIRKNISKTAEYFSAIIRHDAGDEILEW